MSDVKPIPDTYPRITPHLSVVGAVNALEFYERVLGAKVRMRMDAPGGLVSHAEIELGGSVIMLGDEALPGSDPSPKTLGDTPVSLFVYVEDVDDVFGRAVEAGARAVSQPELHLAPSPVTRLHRAIAVRYTAGPEAAMSELGAVAGALERYHLFHATRAELLRALGRQDHARDADLRALDLTANPAERAVLRERISWT